MTSFGQKAERRTCFWRRTVDEVGEDVYLSDCGNWNYVHDIDAISHDWEHCPVCGNHIRWTSDEQLAAEAQEAAAYAAEQRAYMLRSKHMDERASA